MRTPRALVAALVLLCGVLQVVVDVRPAEAAAGPGTPVSAGYWLVGADGGVFGYGATYHGSMGGRPLTSPMVTMAATPSGRGYWTVAADGGVFAFGDAVFYGSTGAVRLNRPIVGMAATPTGRGYWLVASDGGIFAFGDAMFVGSTGGMTLNRPIVGMASTPTGFGYWLVASDGGIFAFGDAKFFGSTGNIKLARPIVAMASSGTGRGYWFVGSDGGVFAYGDAPFLGSAGGVPLNAPVVTMLATPRGLGYWLVASDGGMFTFGEAPFLGSAGALPLQSPVVAIAAPPVLLAAETAIFFYAWWGTPVHDGQWRHWTGHGHDNAPADIPADDYPARGVYSSRDPAVLNAQMREIAAAGVDTLVTSWWGRGGFEDPNLPALAAAARAHGLRVAVHIEPYGGRTPESVADDLVRMQSLGINDAWLYNAMGPPASSWAAVARRFSGFRLFLHTARSTDYYDGDIARYARAGGFDGIYTYGPTFFNRAEFAAACGTARRYRLLCSPSVSPGFSTIRTSLSKSFLRRDNGARYDAQWHDALAVGADTVSITSYNEWHEGTQIEPAVPYCFPDGYCSKGYEGAFGQTGAAAGTAYLGRTRIGSDQLRAARPR